MGSASRETSSWHSWTITATLPENKGKEKLSPPHCQAFYRIHHVFHCTSSFCCQQKEDAVENAAICRRIWHWHFITSSVVTESFSGPCPAGSQTVVLNQEWTLDDVILVSSLNISDPCDYEQAESTCYFQKFQASFLSQLHCAGQFLALSKQLLVLWNTNENEAAKVCGKWNSSCCCQKVTREYHPHRNMCWE